MTHEQQAALLTAARAAAEWISKHEHGYFCDYPVLRRQCAAQRMPEPVESETCTCGSWQTREALRAAIEAGEGERSE